VNLLSLLEPHNHIVNEFLRHLIPEPYPIIPLLDINGAYVKSFKRRWRIRYLNCLLKLQPPNQLFALGGF
jgi:hypothetical protein